jgi:hypothetical protein
MRLFGATLVAFAVIAAFVIGRETGTSSSRVAEAQLPPFSHYQCYQTNTPTNFKPVPVVLKDQFGVSKAVLQPPNMFCAPAQKQLIGVQPHKFAGPADHLLCYPEKGAAKTLVRRVENQLGVSMVRDLLPRWLCVPTRKYEG